MYIVGWDTLREIMFTTLLTLLDVIFEKEKYYNNLSKIENWFFLLKAAGVFFHAQ